MAKNDDVGRSQQLSGTSGTGKIQNETVENDVMLHNNTLMYGLAGVCALLFLIDPIVRKYGPFAIERIWGFYALCGLFACVGVVLGAKVLRAVMIQPEDYYDK